MKITKDDKAILRSYDGYTSPLRAKVEEICHKFIDNFPTLHAKQFSRFVELLRNSSLLPSAKKVSCGERGVLAFELSGENDNIIAQNFTDVLFEKFPQYDGWESHKGKVRYFFDFSKV